MNYQILTKSIKWVKKNPWKTILICLCLTSIFLISQTLYCISYPDKYPTNKIEERISFRDIDGFRVETVEEAFTWSSVIFENCSIKIKQEITVDLQNLNNANVKWICEARLTDNYYSPASVPSLRIKTDTEFYNFKSLKNGQDFRHTVIDIDGRKEYVLPDFNLTEVNKVTTLEVSYSCSMSSYSDDLVNIPVIFNENYAKTINFPIFSLSLNPEDISDINTFKVNLEIPFRQILTDHSGWMDFFVQSESEWVDDELIAGESIVTCFQYPINQTTTNIEETYIFSTYFSKCNIANMVTLVTVPKYNVTIFLVLLLGAPFYILFFDWLSKNKLIEKSTAETEQSFWNAIKTVLIVYSAPLMGILFNIALEGTLNLDLLFYLADIMIFNVFGLLSLLFYPILFAWVLSNSKKQSYLETTNR